MGIPVLIHRWFSGSGEGWAYHPSVKDRYTALRDALRGQASRPPGQVDPIEIPAFGVVLAGIREIDTDRPFDKHDRQLVVLKVAVLRRQPQPDEIAQLEAWLKDCPLPEGPGSCDTLEIPDLPSRPVAMPPVLTASSDESPGDHIETEEIEGDIEQVPVVTTTTTKRRSFVAYLIKIFQVVATLAVLIVVLVGLYIVGNFYVPPGPPNLPYRQASKSDSTAAPAYGRTSSSETAKLKEGKTAKQLNDIEQKFQTSISNAKSPGSLLKALQTLRGSDSDFDAFFQERPERAIKYLIDRTNNILATRKELSNGTNTNTKLLTGILRDDIANLRKVREDCERLLGKVAATEPMKVDFESLERGYESLQASVLIKPLETAFKSLVKKFDQAKADLEFDRLPTQHGQTRTFELTRDELNKELTAIGDACREYEDVSHKVASKMVNDRLDVGTRLNEEAEKIATWTQMITEPSMWRFQVKAPPTHEVIGISLLNKVEQRESSIPLKKDQQNFCLPKLVDRKLYLRPTLRFEVRVKVNGVESKHPCEFDLQTGTSTPSDGITIDCPDIAYFNLAKPDEVFRQGH